MALIKEIVDGIEAQSKAAYDLDNMIENKFTRGTRVSFKNFTYWGDDAPVVTGTVMWHSMKINDFTCSIYLKIAADDQFVPLNSRKADADQKHILIDITKSEYDITIID